MSLILLLACAQTPPSPGDATRARTRPPGGTTLDDDVVLETAGDVDALCASYDRVAGSVRLSGPDLPEDVDLSCLVEVERHVRVDRDASVKHLDLRRLERIGWDLWLDEIEIGVESLDLSALEAVGDDILLREPTALSTLDLTLLRTVGGTFSLHDTAVVHWRLQALESIGGTLHAYNNDGLRTVEAPRLTTAGGVLVETSFAVDTVELTALAEVGSVRMSSLTTLSDLDGLSGLRQVHGSVDLSGTFDGLTDIGGLYGIEVVQESFGRPGRSGVDDAEWDALFDAIGRQNIGGFYEY